MKQLADLPEPIVDIMDFHDELVDSLPIGIFDPFQNIEFGFLNIDLQQADALHMGLTKNIGERPDFTFICLLRQSLLCQAFQKRMRNLGKSIL